MQSPETPNAACHMPEGASSSLSSAASCCDDGLGHDAIFFARVPPMVPYEDLHELFSRFGEVTDLNLFRRWQTGESQVQGALCKGSEISQWWRFEACTACPAGFSQAATSEQNCSLPHTIPSTP